MLQLLKNIKMSIKICIRICMDTYKRGRFITYVITSATYN